MSTMYLNPNNPTCDVMRAACPGYRGRKFALVVAESVTLTDRYWHGGTKSDWCAVDLARGRVAGTPYSTGTSVPWSDTADPEYPLRPGVAVVEHSRFCGKDMGLTLYVHPDNAAKLLPAPVELTDDERLVLRMTASYKNTYGGETNIRFHEGQRKDPTITAERWEGASCELLSRGLLRKNGAITPDGRNAAGDR